MLKTTRRSFLSKICSLLPFGVGLAFVGDSRASEGDVDRWLKECGSAVSKELGWPDGSVQLSITDKPEPIKRSGTEFVCPCRCDCSDQRLVFNGDRIIVACPNHEPYFIYPDSPREQYSYYTGEKLE